MGAGRIGNGLPHGIMGFRGIKLKQSADFREGKAVSDALGAPDIMRQRRNRQQRKQNRQVFPGSGHGESPAISVSYQTKGGQGTPLKGLALFPSRL